MNRRHAGLVFTYDRASRSAEEKREHMKLRIATASAVAALVVITLAGCPSNGGGGEQPSGGIYGISTATQGVESASPH